MRRRTLILAGAGLSAAAAAGVVVYRLTRFPPDTQPDGAYMRVAYSLSRGDVHSIFPYLEDAAQHAAFTIRDLRKRTYDLVRDTYPEGERGRLLAQYEKHAEAPDGSDVFVDMATSRGWIARLRKDLSGVASVEIEGDRATVVTARGTRYSFRRRHNGMWGMTLFTADLVAEATAAARDFDVVRRASEDYERERGKGR